MPWNEVMSLGRVDYTKPGINSIGPRMQFKFTRFYRQRNCSSELFVSSNSILQPVLPRSFLPDRRVLGLPCISPAVVGTGI